MKYRPIIFSAPMVRAILDGRKTQTRRVVSARDIRKRGTCVHGNMTLVCGCQPQYWGSGPYGVPTDRLWVRERIDYIGDGVSVYAADMTPTPADAWVWRRDMLPAMFMPRGLSRITLEVTGVRIEHLQDISADDSVAEGAREGFAALWDSINPALPWRLNPFVWVVTFRRLEA